RRIFNAIQIARYFPCWSEDEYHCWVSVLFGVLVVGVAKAHALGESVNLNIGAGRECPRWVGGRFAERLKVPCFSLRGELGCLRGIDAHRQRHKVPAQLETRPLERIDRAADHQITKHGTPVVGEDQNHRLIWLKELPQPTLLASRIREWQVERNRLAYLLGNLN